MQPILLVVQARMESARLPGKILKPLLAQPMILWQLARVSKVQTPYEMVVASPDTDQNQALSQVLKRHGYTHMLVDGDANDVLGRFWKVGCAYGAEHIVRLTGDCPLASPEVIDGLIQQHLRTGAEHTGIAREWGDGTDCEVFTKGALSVAYHEATLPSDREHVTPFIWRQPERFRCCLYAAPLDYSWLRASVDTKPDLLRVQKLLTQCLLRYGHGFTWRDVWTVTETDAWMKQEMQYLDMNPAYLAQVAQEQGQELGSVTWNQVRYQHQGA